MRFEYDIHLFALWIIPVLILISLLVRKKQTAFLSQLGNLHLLNQIIPYYAQKRKKYRFILLLLACIFLIIAWANPQWGLRTETTKSNSADVIIAMDVSQSMLAEDIQPNRLEKAKKLAIELINYLKGDRIGLIIFAGDAFLQNPLTTDYAAIALFVQSANPDLIPTQGTAITQALNVAQKTFVNNEKNHKAIILISDGENHDDEAVRMAALLKENGIFTFSIGLGTVEGAPIPISSATGNKQYKSDNEGKIVISRLNNQALSTIANNGSGSYYPVTTEDVNIPNDIKEKLNKLERMAYEEFVFSEHESYFQVFILGALFFLLIEFFLPSTIGK